MQGILANPTTNTLPQHRFITAMNHRALISTSLPRHIRLWVAALLVVITGIPLFVSTSRAAEPVAGDSRPNVLFIAVDDLNHWVGYTGRNPQTITPNIDRLSAMGVSFTHAYCPAPACNPSRAALMSGLRPSTTGCYLNDDKWQRFIPEGLGLAMTFRKAGYYVAGAGKIYHASTFYPGEWDDYRPAGKETGSEEDEQTAHGKGVNKMEGFQQAVKHDLNDDDLADWHVASFTINQLGKNHDRPFFLACGFHKPHLPWVVPQKYYDLFPLDSIQLPPYREDDLDDLPAAGLKMARPEQDHHKLLASGRWKEAIRSYLACVAYTDMNVGRVLEALEKSPYANNTIICFWSDHGWHLGEKHHWRKFALWEEATRTPFIWVVPGVTKAGQISSRPVELMSIYPTLCDLTGVSPPTHVEGESITTLLASPVAEWTPAALTTHGFQNHAVRTEAWRYIRYADKSEELYDEIKDPYEWTNLAGKPELQALKAELARHLPQSNKLTRKPVKGSKQD
jgi:arylsulfatase A-like enzyme